MAAGIFSPGVSPVAAGLVGGGIGNQGRRALFSDGDLNRGGNSRILRVSYANCQRGRGGIGYRTRGHPIGIGGVLVGEGTAYVGGPSDGVGITGVGNSSVKSGGACVVDG